jgi:uncharacterized protein
MSESLVVILSLLLIVVGIVGCILPILPGILLSFGGLALYYFFGETPYWSWLFYSFTLLSLASLALNYLIPIRYTKKYGGSRWSNYMGMVGMLLGFFIPIPFGFLVGMILAVLLTEYFITNDWPKAIQASKGALIGFLLSTFFNLSLALAMLISVVWRLVF